MPGIVEKIFVSDGKEVNAGEPLLVMIAMKMEYVIRAPQSGVVEKVFYKVGDNVAKNAPLVKFLSVKEDEWSYEPGICERKLRKVNWRYLKRLFFKQKVLHCCSKLRGLRSTLVKKKNKTNHSCNPRGAFNDNYLVWMIWFRGWICLGAASIKLFLVVTPITTEFTWWWELV